jgi:hypothetical protein
LIALRKYFLVKIEAVAGRRFVIPDYFVDWFSREPRRFSTFLIKDSSVARCSTPEFLQARKNLLNWPGDRPN